MEHLLNHIEHLAPNFELPSTSGEILSVERAKGRPLVLVFYPWDFTPVCSSQLTLYQELQNEYREYDFNLWGISVDDLESHRSFAQKLRIAFPLLSDSDPLGAASRAFGIFREEEKICERALFVIDRAGFIRWRHVSPIDINPGADGIINALAAIG